MSNAYAKKPLVWVALVGLFLTVLAPMGLAAAGDSSPASDSSPVADDSSVGNDSSPVGDDSSPVGDDSRPVGDDSSPTEDPPGTVTIVEELRLLWGGTLTVGTSTIVIDGQDYVDGDVVSLAPGTYSFGTTTPPDYYRSVLCDDSNNQSALDDFGLFITVTSDVAVTCTMTVEDRWTEVNFFTTIINDDLGVATRDDVHTFLNNEEYPDNAITAVGLGSHSVSWNAPGYEVTSLTCYERDTETAQPGVDATFEVLILNGYVRCEITFDDLPAGSLTLNAEVVNDNGGTLDASTTTLQLDGLTVDHGESTEVVPGTHTVGRPGSTYEITNISCVLDADGSTVPAVDGSVDVPSAEAVTCTITLDDIPGSIGIDYAFVNDNGGLATSADQVATVDGVPVAPSGTVVDADAGDHNVQFWAPAGYELTSIDCEEITGIDPYGLQITDLDPDEAFEATFETTLAESVTCSAVFDDLPAQLTVLKEVINDNGGTDDPSDVTIYVNGEAHSSGDVLGVDAGTHMISESRYGYIMIGIDCADDTDGATVPVIDGEVTVANGQSVTCTVTNDDEPAHVTVVKEVVNDDGGLLEATDFVLRVDSVEVPSGATVDANAGLHYVHEDAMVGYTQTSFVCVDDDTANTVPSLNGVFGASLAQNITCTFVNDDDPAYLTITKTVLSDNGGDLTEADAVLYVDGDIVVDGETNSVGAGLHTITEDEMPGYELTEIACTDDDSGDAVAHTDGVVELANGQSVTCAITNDDLPATVTLVKIVENNDGGNLEPADFVLNVDDGQYASGDVVTVDAGDHTLSEDLVDGYFLQSQTCVDDGSGLDVPMTFGQFTVVNGQAITCTLTNDDQKPTISVAKIVVNDHGGNAEPADATLRINGTIRPADQSVFVTAGTHSVSEDAMPGYTLADLSCTEINTGDSRSHLDGEFELAVGEDVHCVFTNDDDPASITLVKLVVNDHNGPATPADAELFVDAQLVSSGTTVLTSAGSHTISEAPMPGYVLAVVVCEDADEQPVAIVDGEITVVNGQVVTCHFTNDDLPASITVLKEVINDDAGPATAADAELLVDGVSLSSGDSIEVAAGGHTLAEADVDGYALSEITCVDDELGVPVLVIDDMVTVSNDQSVTCTFVNDDQPALITVNGAITNDDSGTATDSDFSYVVDGNALNAGEQAEVAAGNWSIDANTPTGYYVTGVDCVSTVGPVAVFGNVVTVTNGADVLCTVSFNDAPECGGELATVLLGPDGYGAATSGADVIVGSNKADTINGFGGDDIICGMGGDDTIDGGTGDDLIYGGRQHDTIVGGLGQDTIYGNHGNDTIDGGSQADAIFGGAGNDILRGGGAADVIRGGASNDQIWGNRGQDALFGGIGSDTLIGGNGNDMLSGGNGNDILRGQRHDDHLMGGVGNDTLGGGAGIDSCAGDAGIDTAWMCEVITSTP